MEALEDVLPELRDAGANLVAISPQKPEYSRTLRADHGISFDLLSDHNNEVARKFGVVYDMPEKLKQLYEAGFDLDIPEYNGVDSWQLPMPARFIIEPSGTIRRADAQPDHSDRPEPRETVEIVRAL